MFYLFCTLREVRGQLWELVRSFPPVSPWDGTQILFGSKPFYPLSHLTGPNVFFLEKKKSNDTNGQLCEYSAL